MLKYKFDASLKSLLFDTTNFINLAMLIPQILELNAP